MSPSRMRSFSPATSNSCSPTNVQPTGFPVIRSSHACIVNGCRKQDYAVLIVVGLPAAAESPPQSAHRNPSRLVPAESNSLRRAEVPGGSSPAATRFGGADHVPRLMIAPRIQVRLIRFHLAHPEHPGLLRTPRTSDSVACHASPFDGAVLQAVQPPLHRPKVLLVINPYPLALTTEASLKPVNSRYAGRQGILPALNHDS